jgi:hypothetical protein
MFLICRIRYRLHEKMAITDHLVEGHFALVSDTTQKISGRRCSLVNSPAGLCFKETLVPFVPVPYFPEFKEEPLLYLALGSSLTAPAFRHPRTQGR